MPITSGRSLRYASARRHKIQLTGVWGMALGDRRAQSAPTSSCARKAMISRITPVLAGAVALVTIAQEKPQAQTQKLDKILFVSDRGSSGRSHLFALNLDGSQPSRIIQSGEAELDGVFSPGGKQ